ncbi:ribose 5-phosphate isomerase A [Salinicoccus albus]|uniref:ribose 5-phosphate isomerase A n=1 Tax=Salinicoccus albus TaxID=418756 RepID=UPI000360AEE2|nr:ribose 5-phosphate isomerase A [Salinicoccus albus]
MKKAYGLLNERINDESIIGMGSGTTIAGYIPALKQYIMENGLNVRFLSTSKKTENLLEAHNLEVICNADDIDLTIDGADQFDPHLNVIKGGGGSLLREKQIGYYSEEIHIIADRKKLVADFDGVGIPVELNPYLYEMTVIEIEQKTGAETTMRKNGTALFVTDNQNYIVDCTYEKQGDLTCLHNKLLNIPGVVETGIFDRHIAQIIAFDDSDVEIFN